MNVIAIVTTALLLAFAPAGRRHPVQPEIRRDRERSPENVPAR